MNHLEVLRVELERLFDLDGLLNLSREVLGFPPEQVGGQASLNSFARALLSHCEAEDATFALTDALLASGKDLNPQIAQITEQLATDNTVLAAGSEFGDYRITRLLGEGRLGATYLAKSDDGEVRLKILHPEAVRDRRAMQRYLVATRLAGKMQSEGAPGLPALVYAGKMAKRIAAVHSYVEGQPLSARIARTGPLHMNEARPLLASIAGAVAALHDGHLVHGSLSLDNIVVFRDAEGNQAIALLDLASDRLRFSQGKVRTGLSSTGGNPRTVSPEQVRGNDAERASDIYSLGALMYELLTGKPVFDGNVLDVAYDHLKTTPKPPSDKAPRGWITSDIDEVLLRLLSKSPAERGSARQLLGQLDDLGRAKKSDDFDESQLEELEQKLLAAPGDSSIAMNLEASVGRGASAERIGQAFRLAASMIDDPIQVEVKTSLLLRAARLLEQGDDNLDKAEAIYEELIGLSPRDAVALAGIEEVRRRSGKFEELIEMLLLRAEAAEGEVARAHAMGEIGKVYLRDLQDYEQAVIAYVQAYCDDPKDEYSSEVGRAAGTNEALWAEALSALGEASQNTELPQEQRTQLLLTAGTWYLQKVSRPDLALPCFQAVLAQEPANEVALVSTTGIYRKSQQWQELGQILTHRADAAATPAQARDLRAEAAHVLEGKLGDVQSARAIYELILSEDPAHQVAGDSLARILENAGDFATLVKRLEARIASQPKAEAIRSLCHIGEIYDAQLDKTPEATAIYRQALTMDSQNLDALRGLERIFTKKGQYQELLENLEEQIRVSATPKQRIGLLERIAAVYEEEFLNHEDAAKALHRALETDPGRVSAMASLIRQLRVLERWEEASKLYERQLELVEDSQERISLAMAWGRLLSDQLKSPEQATHAYELVIAQAPEHAGALEALAKLREATGDAEHALDAILSLADQATSPAVKAEQFIRAAALLESIGQRDRAIEQYKNALDCQPEDRTISSALRNAYVEKGDITAAVELLEREIEIAEGDRTQGKLAGEMAHLQLEGLKDREGAERSAKRALQLDPGNLDALLVLGDICFTDKHYVEASSHYGRIASRVETLGKSRAVPVLMRYVDALAQAGSTENALAAMDVLLRLAPEDGAALGRVAEVIFEHGSPQRAGELLHDYLTRFGDSLTERERAVTTYQLGECYRRNGDLEAAVTALNASTELDPGAPAPLKALTALYLDQKNYEDAVTAITQHLDIVEGDERLELLIQIGDISAQHLNDRTQATTSYVAALEERPDDRRLLTKLMQLYSEDKDWNKLVDVVVKLAEFVDEPAQKVKYLQTAALVTARQIGDPDQAAAFFEQVLELDPSNAKAMTELQVIHREAGNYNAVEDLIKRSLALAESTGDLNARLKAYDSLAELYAKHIIEPDFAAESLEAALALEPGNHARLEQLASIYDSDPEAFQEKGIQLQEYLLSQNPFRQEGYKALRKIYTVARDADASWALCQVLTVLKLAEPDEERFYSRMRAETAAPAQDALNEEDWLQRIIHPQLDPLLTAVFGLIQPAVVRARALPPSQLGVGPEMLIEPSQHHSPLAQTIYYAAGVLGIEIPHVYANSADPGGLSYLLADTPSLSLGKMGQSSQVPPQVAAFVAAQQLAYLRPGLYMRHFVQTGTALKSWLFAAIKLTAPQFPIAPNLEGNVNEALAALRTNLTGEAKDHLASVVSRLIQSGSALDLKKWVAAVDLTADRVGFIVAHDLQTTVEFIRAADPTLASMPAEDRFRELVLYASSQRYFEMRKRLSIRVDS